MILQLVAWQAHCVFLAHRVQVSFLCPIDFYCLDDITFGLSRTKHAGVVETI